MKPEVLVNRAIEQYLKRVVDAERRWANSARINGGHVKRVRVAARRKLVAKLQRTGLSRDEAVRAALKAIEDAEIKLAFGTAK